MEAYYAAWISLGDLNGPGGSPITTVKDSAHVCYRGEEKLVVKNEMEHLMLRLESVGFFLHAAQYVWLAYRASPTYLIDRD